MMQDLTMHIIDILQNSIKAGADFISLIITEDEGKNLFSFSVEDNGKGMDEKTVAKVRDPFVTSRTTRRVGLGIPLLEQTCQMCGGSLAIKSAVGRGTYVCARMELNNIDRPPLGDLAGGVYMTMVTNPEIDFLFRYIKNEKVFEADTREIKKILNGVSISEPEVSLWLKENIYEGMSFK